MSAMKRINIGILLLSCICLAGCWDNYDIEGLSIVMATGFDKGKENRGEPLELTTQIAVFQSTIQGQTSIKPPYQNITLAGDSVHEILRNFSLELPKPIFTQHQKVLMIGEDLARSINLQDLFDQNIRDNNSRMSPEICIASPSAKQVLDVPGKTETPTERIMETLKNRFRTAGILPVVSLGDVKANFVSNTSFLLQKIDIQHGQLVFDGAGIVKGSKKKLIGTLTKEELEGIGWITGQIEGGLVKVKNQADQVMVYEIQSVDSRVKLSKKNGQPSFHIYITSKGRLSEDWTSPGNAFQNKKLKEVERLAGDQVKVWIKNALGKLQGEYRTDVLKFGEKYRIQYPREWEKVKGKWDELFAEADITYDVDINIDNFGSSGRKK